MQKNTCTLIVLFLALAIFSFSQAPKFKLVLDEKETSIGPIFSLTQDLQGYIWFGSGGKGLHRYDGKKLTAFRHDPENPNSPAPGLPPSICVDSAGMIWVAYAEYGIDRLNPSTNTFTHFRHNPRDTNSLGNDSIFSMMVDRKGNLWIGTYRGLDRYDEASGKFIHYDLGNGYKEKNKKDVFIFSMYEDTKGAIWLGWGNPFVGEKTDPGGLSRFDKATGKFTHYHYNPADPNSLENNNVTAIFEDSRGNFWVGTKGDGLHTLNRNTGKFTHFYNDPDNPQALSRPPSNKGNSNDFISFITEDILGKIWIGTSVGGLNYYDPESKKVTHYGLNTENNVPTLLQDTLTGFTANGAIRVLHTRDGILWFTGFPAGLYNLQFNNVSLPFQSVIKGSTTNSFFLEPDGVNLWIGTDSGLLKKNLVTRQEKTWIHDAKRANSISSNEIVAIRNDDDGNLWVATHYGGLNKFNKKTERFTHYRYDSLDKASLVFDEIHYLFFDHEKKLWIGTHNGLAEMDTKTEKFTNYKYDKEDSASLSGGIINCIAEDSRYDIWTAGNGVSAWDRKTRKFRKYMEGENMTTLCIDKNGLLWAGGDYGLFYYEPQKDVFVKFAYPGFPEGLENIKGMIEDDKGYLWLRTNNALVRINEKHDDIKLFKSSSGVLPILSGWMDPFKTKDGCIFLEDNRGFFLLNPKEVVENISSMMLEFTSFTIGDKIVESGQNELLKEPIWKTTLITLPFDNNTFSIEFNAIDYQTSGEIKYLFMLENYEKVWHEIGSDHKASFFNIPDGKYILRVKAINAEGAMAERSINIVITPPWWRTWWAYSLYAIMLILAGWGIYLFQKQYIIKKERERTQQKELAQAKEIEKAYTELKATQAQLVQSEKMASLGELTAGIAHEIQNPLNFVNNFSEVSSELISELVEEVDKGNTEEVKSIAKDVQLNLEKINHHGKRADAIVKGMLQHTRTSSGQKESIDINELCDEYLRLAYHGLRAKDKEFNATLQTDFDTSIGHINIIPQDMGRVLLNLINNAFYAVDEKKKQVRDGYEPAVTVSTKKNNGQVAVSVKDNGNGIPQKVLDKIFQPFFTTKPTGQGTGLGLSLSYDIVKAHGGELKVETKEGEGSTFILQLPVV